MTNLDSPRIRQALIAAKGLNQEAGAGGGSGFSRGQRLARDRRARGLAEEQLASMGFDAAALERELAAERMTSRRRLEEVKAEAVAHSGARADSLRNLVDARRAALNGVVGVWPAGTQYLTLDSPVEIWATDRVNLESSTIEPYHSRAQIRLDASLYKGLTGAYLLGWNYDLLHFYYLWGNTHAGVSAVVTVQANLVLNGFCSAHSRGGWFFGGEAQLSLDPTLDLLQTWTQPLSSAPRQGSQSQHALGLVADSTGFDTDDQTAYEVEFRGFSLDYQQEIVPAGQYLIIDVALNLGSYVDNGEVSADFATGEFYVMSPFVQLAIDYPAIGDASA